jgi:hypothetical protein
MWSSTVLDQALPRRSSRAAGGLTRADLTVVDERGHRVKAVGVSRSEPRALCRNARSRSCPGARRRASGADRPQRLGSRVGCSGHFSHVTINLGCKRRESPTLGPVWSRPPPRTLPPPGQELFPPLRMSSDLENRCRARLSDALSTDLHREELPPCSGVPV